MTKINFIVANLPDDLRTTFSSSLADAPVRQTADVADRNEPELRSSDDRPPPQMDSADVFQSYHEEL
jgi:hypothetical protein